MTDEQARLILKKHAALYGDEKYEPASWVIDAIKEVAFMAEAGGRIAALNPTPSTREDIDRVFNK